MMIIKTKNKITGIVFILSVLVSVLTALGYVGHIYWLFDLCAHFRLQYTVLLLILFLFYLINRHIYWAGILLFFLAINLYEIGGLYFSQPRYIPEMSLKICSINLWSRNTETQAVTDYIRMADPDILVLQEFNERWQNALELVLASYPYQQAIVRSNNFGIAIYSKVEIQNITELSLSTASVPSLLATLNFHDRPLKLLATHPVPPVGQQSFNHRNNQLEAIASMKHVLGDTFVVIGDLNTTSYAPNFKQMLADMQLKDSRQGFGILPTWPAYFFPLMVTIDHCLVSQNISVAKRAVGNNIGSDHLPIYVEIGF